MLMNFQRQGRCPGVELAAECELSPRGEGANKTQHNTNKPLSCCEPASQPVSRVLTAESSMETRRDNEEAFMPWSRNLTNNMQPTSIRVQLQRSLVPDAL